MKGAFAIETPKITTIPVVPWNIEIKNKARKILSFDLEKTYERWKTH